MYCPSFPDAPIMHTFCSPLIIVLLLVDYAEVGDISAARSSTRSIATVQQSQRDTEVLFGVLLRGY
jgi:hypothetical protein